MKNRATLIAEAEAYVAAYARKYNVTDEAELYALYVSHLTYLMNQ